MTQTRYIAGQPGLIRSIFRTLVVGIVAIGSLFLLISSAVVAFFILAGLVFFGFVAFSIFWAKAKITGKPFGPKAQFEQARRDMEAQFQSYQETVGDGPVLDAQETPDGWSVEE